LCDKNCGFGSKETTLYEKPLPEPGF